MGTPIVINSARDYAIRHGRLKKEEMEIRTKFKKWIKAQTRKLDAIKEKSVANHKQQIGHLIDCHPVPDELEDEAWGLKVKEAYIRRKKRQNRDYKNQLLRNNKERQAQLDKLWKNQHLV